MLGGSCETPVDVGITRHDGHQMQIGIVAKGASEQIGDPLRPQVLVLDIDQPPGARHRLVVAARDAALTVRREVVFEMRIGVGSQHLNRVRSARGRIRRLLRQSARRQVRAPQLVLDPGDRRQHVQCRRVVPALPERRVQRADDRALYPQLHVVPRRMLAVALGHLHRLWVAAVRRVVAAGVAQVDAARERDVALGCVRSDG